MRKLVICVVVAGLLFGAWGSLSQVWAGEGQVASVNKVFGPIAFIDVDAKKITVKNQMASAGMSVDIFLQESTLVMKDGRKAALADLAVGDYVTVAYTADDQGQNVAVTVFQMSKAVAPKV